MSNIASFGFLGSTSPNIAAFGFLGSGIVPPIVVTTTPGGGGDNAKREGARLKREFWDDWTTRLLLLDQ